MNISSELKSGKSDAEKIAYAILLSSLLSPISQILENAGLSLEDIYLGSKFKKGEGYNVVTGEKGKMIDLGVIDPTKVTVSALSNAISVANTILSTNAIITMAHTIQYASNRNIYYNKTMMKRLLLNQDFTFRKNRKGKV